VHSQNIALAKNAYCSGQEAASFSAYHAIDGHGSANVNTSDGSCTGSCTRWSSGFTDNQWMYIDLAGMYDLTEVRLYWEASNGKNFTIDVSNDALSWTTIHTVTNNTAFFHSFNMTGQTARYVRMMGTARNTIYGYSIYEFEVYGTPVLSMGTNIALNKPAVASTINSPGQAAANATDGNGNASQVDYRGGCIGSCTYWTSLPGAGEWIYVDLGATFSLGLVRFFWENGNSPRSFEVQVSNDALSWTTAATVTEVYDNANTVNIQGFSGRYVRMLGLTGNTSFYSLFEFEVYQLLLLTVPVHFSAFTGNMINNQVDLVWKASIDHPTVFEVERSIDGVHYSNIGVVEGSAPPGHTTEYRYRDDRPATGMNYYRLRYTERGSAPIYSKVVMVTGRQGAAVSILPNPVRGNQFQVNLGSVFTGNVEIMVLNTAGKVMHQTRMTSAGEQLIPVSLPMKLATGVYTIRVGLGDTIKVTRLVITE